MVCTLQSGGVSKDTYEGVLAVDRPIVLAQFDLTCDLELQGVPGFCV